MTKKIRNTSEAPHSFPITGTLPYSMTNDYLFHAVLQKSNIVLKGLICSLLHLESYEVSSVIIVNPIELGKSIDSKTFILDIHVILNNQTHINLEMQLINKGNWPERSLSYLCRTFDNLKEGDDYSQVQPAVHISFLDFTPFPDRPEFYSNYMLMNVKNYSIYSDKFRLSVVDLTQIGKATKEDKAYQIDYWAALFKATTWEDIQMIVDKNNCLEEAAYTIYQLMQDENIRLQCQARDEYYRTERRWERTEKAFAEANAALAETNAALTETKSALAETKSALAEKDATLAEKDAALAEKDAALAEKDALIQKILAQNAEHLSK